MLAETAAMLNAFHQSLAAEDGPGAIVECTPIRVGRYPQLMVDLARRTKVHVIASTGFWCEAMAPQHPWAVRMGIEPDGADRIADLFVREITEGMENPHGDRGERFTNLRAGAIKIGTSALMRPSEKAVHIGAAMASRRTGCPITTHTTNGGGLEQARLLLKSGADPGRVIIGHQGHMDDGKNAEAGDYHLEIARLGCCLQFDRVGAGNYDCDKQARLIRNLIASGFERQILVSHDHVPYFYREFSEETKDSRGWRENQADFTIVTTKLTASLEQLGVSQSQIRTLLVDNPRRVLAF
jgi:phosphotriesterase-related protein